MHATDTDVSAATEAAAAVATQAAAAAARRRVEDALGYIFCSADVCSRERLLAHLAASPTGAPLSPAAVNTALTSLVADGMLEPVPGGFQL